MATRTERSLWGEAVDSRRRTAREFQRYATLSAVTHRLQEPELSEDRREEVRWCWVRVGIRVIRSGSGLG